MGKQLAFNIWRGFCKSTINIFYRNYEVAGFENIPQDCGVIFCANHVNALVDPILIQAASDRVMRPLARSGLFTKLWLKPVLNIIGAVPIYRSQDQGTDPTQNKDSFLRVYELLEQREWIMIFPEGQSHSQSKIQQLKTGAARMVLGTIERGQSEPVLIPVGLTFTNKGKFRGDVLVYFGQPVDLSAPADTKADAHARVITRRLTQALRDVTINTENWEDLELVSKIERFFSLRHGKYRKRNLFQRFQTLKRIISKHQLLRQQQPKLVEQVTTDLRRFEQICRSLGIKDYHLTVAYRPFLVIFYSLKIVMILLIGLPLFFWTVVNSFIPFYLTRHLARYFAKSSDQFDTTKILLGLFLFSIFWVVQIYLVYQYFGLNIMAFYVLSLIVGSVIVLRMHRDIFSIKENIYVFFLFVRNRGLKEHLLAKRNNLERELAKLVKAANRLIDKQESST